MDSGQKFLDDQDKRKNILFLAIRGARGGAQVHLLQLALKAKNQGFNVFVGIGEPGWLNIELKKVGISVFSFSYLKRNWNPFGVFLFISEFRNFLSQNKIDLIHAHSSKSLFGLLGFKKKNVRPATILTIHGWSVLHPGWKKSKILKKLYTFITKILFKNVDKIIYVTKADQELGEKLNLFPKEKATVIYNGIPSTITFLEKNIARSTIETIIGKRCDVLVGTVARLDYSKNLDMLIMAAEKTHDMNVQYVIIGEGSDGQRLRALILEKGVSDRVFILESIPDPKRFMRGFDQFIMTSRYEGLPYTLLEAASSKTPIISTDVGGVKEIVDHDVSGRLISSDDVSALVNEIQYLCTHKEQAALYAFNAYKRVLTTFSEKEMFERTFALYRTLV